MSKHTVGPWFADKCRVYSRHDLRSASWVAGTDSPYVTAEGALANARLIAAAPLMLEALKRIRDNCADNDAENWIWRTAEQAINAAEGK